MLSFLDSKYLTALACVLIAGPFFLGGFALFTIGTAFIFHFPSPEDPYTFSEEVSMIGGLLLLAAVGPSAISRNGLRRFGYKQDR